MSLIFADTSGLVKRYIVVFMCADDELNQAAQAAGLDVFNPASALPQIPEF
jgi:hypothetical protein